MNREVVGRAMRRGRSSSMDFMIETFGVNCTRSEQSMQVGSANGKEVEQTLYL